MKAIYAVVDCAQEKADELASGSDNADIIASAIPDLCSYEIAVSVNQDWKKHPGRDREELEKSTQAEAVSRARVEVLRQRAGHCSLRQ